MSLYNRMILRSLGRRNDMYAKEIADELFLPAWDDIQGSVAEGVGNAALTYETYRDTPFKMYFMRSGQADELNFAFQMSHTWNPKTAVRPHMHIVPMADPATTKIFALTVTYAWARYGVAVPANTDWTVLPVTHNVLPGDVYKSTIISLGVLVPPVGTKESDVLLLQAKRNTAVDTYDDPKDPGTGLSNVGILSVDVHYQKNKLGTQLEFPP